MKVTRVAREVLALPPLDRAGGRMRSQGIYCANCQADCLVVIQERASISGTALAWRRTEGADRAAREIPKEAQILHCWLCKREYRVSLRKVARLMVKDDFEHMALVGGDQRDYGIPVNTARKTAEINGTIYRLLAEHERARREYYEVWDSENQQAKEEARAIVARLEAELEKYYQIQSQRVSAGVA